MRESTSDADEDEPSTDEQMTDSTGRDDTVEMSFSDITGTLREIQGAIRRRYSASRVDLETERPVENQNSCRVLSTVTYKLVWEQRDLPEDIGMGPTETRTELLLEKLQRAQEDFPTAEFSTYAAPNRARLNIRLGTGVESEAEASEATGGECA